jgi:hypothetical protein
MMKALRLTVLAALAAVAMGATAHADPGKDESGKNRWRGSSYERDDRPRGYDDGRAYRGDRRERRAFKQEYDDGTCKYERKLEKSGEYKEEVKCRPGRQAPSAAYRYR